MTLPRPRVLPALEPDDLDPEILIRLAIEKLRTLGSDQQRDIAIERLEEAVLWLNAEEALR